MTKRGRKARVITEEMIEDLTKLNMEQYCEKHKVGEMYFLNLYYKNVGKPKEIEKEVEIDIFNGVLVDTEIMYEKGFGNWQKHIQEKQQHWDWVCSDILHRIECKKSNQAEKIVLYDMLEEARLKRRKYTDSWDFGNANRHKIIDLLELRKLINGRRQFLKERKYKVRVLVEAFGKEIKE